MAVLGVMLAAVPSAIASPPANDNFADGTAIVQPGTSSGTNVDATTESGELEHAGQPAAHSIWYTAYAPPVAARFRISTCGSSIDTVLAVYQGVEVGSLTQVAANDDSVKCGSGGGSFVVVDAEAHGIYHIVIDGKADAEGAVELHVEGPPANDFFVAPMPISQSFESSRAGNNEGASKEPGEPEHAGQQGGASVWYQWTPESDGEAEISTCSSSGIDTLLAVYTGSSLASLVPEAGNDDSGDGCQSGDSAVHLAVSEDTTYLIAVDGKNETEGAFTLEVQGQPTPQAGQISGTVTSSGGALLEGIGACVYEASSGQYVECSYTNTSGEYTIEGLEAGEYKVEFYDPSGVYLTQYFQGKPSLDEAGSVSVELGESEPGIDAAMEEGGKVTGKVTDSHGTALKGAYACVYEADSGENVGCASTNDEGNYEVGGLLSGEYKVGFSAPDGNLLDQYYDGKATLDEAVPVEVIQGQIRAGVNAELQEGGTISGTVTDDSGGLLSGIVVCAETRGGTYAFGCAYTGSGGAYEIAGLSAGTYYVRFSLASGTPGSYLTQYYDGRYEYEEAEPVSVEPGTPEVGIDAVMKEAAKITGTVTDGEDPIANVNVCLYPAGYDYSTSCVYTDSSGVYAFTGLGKGSYRVHFQGPSGSNYLPEFYDNAHNLASAAAISVDLGEAKDEVDAALQEGGEIEGHIEAGGVDLPYAEACAYLAGSSMVASCSQTDIDGKYTVGGLSSGSYEVRFSPPYGENYLSQYYEDQPSRVNAKAVSVIVGEATTDINAILHPGGEIDGTVRDASGTPIPSVSVCAYKPTSSGYSVYVACTSTGPSGAYALVGLAGGRYEIRFDAYSASYIKQYYDGKYREEEADLVTANAGATVHDIDATLREGATIKGTVGDFETHQTIEDARVCAYEVGGVYYLPSCAYTGSDGSYSITALPPGRYKVRFESPGGQGYVSQYYESKATYAKATALVLGLEDERDNVDAELRAGARIDGTVKDEAGKGVESVEVCARLASSGKEVQCAYTDGDGTYGIDGLPADSYKVQFSPSRGANYLGQYFKDAETFAGAEPLTLAAGDDAASTDATLHPGAQIRGTVRGEANVPLEGVEVCLSEFDGEGESAGCGETGSDGTYAIGGLGAGEYRVSFFGGSGYLSQYYDGKASYSEATPVELQDSEDRSGIDAHLEAAGKISGTVTDGESQPISGVSVCVYRNGGGETQGCGFTDAAGHYMVGALAEAAYVVHFFPTSNFLSEYYEEATAAGDAKLVNVTAGGEQTGIDAALEPAGRIAGRVADKSSSEGVSNVSVCAYGVTNGLLGGCTTTDSEGIYGLGGLSTGQYKVAFSGGGHVTQYYDGKGDLAEAEPVGVTAGETTLGVDALLEAGGTIKGHVEDQDSEPLGGIRICETPEGSYEQRCVSSNGAGNYTLSGLSTGNYKVEFSAGASCGGPEGCEYLNYETQYFDSKASPDLAEAVHVDAGQAHTGVNARMQVAASIAGHVTEVGSGDPISGVYVCAFRGSATEPERCAVTNIAGGYLLIGLVGEPYKLSFESPYGSNWVDQFYSDKPTLASAEDVDLDPGQAKEGVDVQLQTGGRIEGHVSAASGGASLGDVEVCAYETDGEEPASCTETNSTGNYRLSGLAAVPYQVEFSAGWVCDFDGCTRENYARQFFSGKDSRADATTVTVQANEVAQNVDASMHAGGKISGLVTKAEGGDPLAGISVCAYRAGETEAEECAESTEDGTYAISRLTTGPHKVGFETSSNCGGPCPAQSYETQYYNGKSSLAAADAVEVTEGGEETGVNAAMSEPTVAGPESTSAPRVTGTPDVGESLTCTDGSWTGSPTLVRIWLRDGGEISGQSATTYEVKAADAGHQISCKVTATNAGGSTNATSASVHVPAPPLNTVAPALSGNASVGSTLTCSTGSWDYSPSSYAYSWWRGTTVIAGEEASSYEVQADDQGANVTCRVTATNDDGSASATSNPVAVPAAVGAPSNTALPQVTGTPAVGQTLTCTDGTWTGSPTLTRAWLRDGAPIDAQTGQTYHVQPGDAGHTIRCEVTATNEGGSAAALSDAVDVPPKPTNTALPQVTGTPAVGQTLTCTDGTWTGSPTLTRAWLRDGGAISGQAASTYVVQSADQGHQISCQVTATNSGGSIEATSAEVSVPAPPVSAPSNTGLPRLTGTPAVGQTLTCTDGTWTGSPTLTRAWLRDGGAISGQAASTYVVQSADQGHGIACRVTASNGGGSASANSNTLNVAAATETPTGGGDTGGGDSSGGGGTSATPPAAPLSPVPTVTHKPKTKRLKCKKGFKKKKLKRKGKVKVKCVKVKKKKKRKR